MVITVPTEKDQEFVRFLLDSTRNGKMQWEPTAEPNQFTTTLQAKYTVLMARVHSTSELILKDDADQELVKVNSIYVEEVEELYEFVRRQALNVDAVLDNLMGGQQK